MIKLLWGTLKAVKLNFEKLTQIIDNYAFIRLLAFKFNVFNMLEHFTIYFPRFGVHTAIQPYITRSLAPKSEIDRNGR